MWVAAVSVGPRPPLPRETEKCSDEHWRRLEVLPGMTGLWQVLPLRTIPAALFARGAY
ncbi:MAG: sugar transferase [Actinomycetota bacterium]|nr:sugar transferase [Actinomycetota bacterium]